jgi:WD40 repeat protein
MARFRFYLGVLLIPLLWSGAGRGQDAENPPGLYDRPVLVVDKGTHIRRIWTASADREGRWAVTGSEDKTIRIWSLADGKLDLTIRLPAGPGDIGRANRVAISPDGALIAAGGVTRGDIDQEQIYLFDRSKGTLLQRIQGLRSMVRVVVFSPDGSRLAAFGGEDGLRVYAKEAAWGEIARDEDYSEPGYGADFAPDGRLATTSFDGKLRLYSAELTGRVHPTVTVDAPGGGRPYRIKFSPADGARIAVGYNRDDNTVDLLDGHSLEPLHRADTKGVKDNALTVVAWSPDGEILYASGGDSVLAWSQAGTGPRRLIGDYPRDLGVDEIVALPGDDLLVALETKIIRLDSNGITRWAQQAQIADFRAQFDNFMVSADGLRVKFGYEYEGKSPALFDVATRSLLVPPSGDPHVSGPKQIDLNISDPRRVKNWRSGNSPTLDGQRLPMLDYEDGRSLAIHPNGKSFVLGTGWNLRAYDTQRKVLWNRNAPGGAWAVNITGNGRLVVAACGDGSIRWYRMVDGTELLAFMPMPDHTNWVAWTPEGFYAATAGAQGVLRWHVNRGWEPADSVPVEDIPGSYRPEVLPLVLQELETPRALGLAELAEHNRQVMLRTQSHISPGAQLHLLTIGIDQYNEEYARNLRLQFADRDARDLASAIITTQEALYHVRPTVLLDRDANKTGILRALKNMRAAMASGSGNDLAVIHFSGHGALVDRKLYLLPYDVDARDDAGIQSKGVSTDELRGELAELGQHGRVLVLLDACHSGATTTDGSPLTMDSTALRTALAAANVSVLTSSTGSEVSFEEPELQHGAFTKVLLDAFDDPAVDVNRNGLITPNGLAAYIANRVPTLTGGKQHPGMEVRYDTTLFARNR